MRELRYLGGPPDFEEPCFLCDNAITRTCVAVASPSLYDALDKEFYYAHRACFNRITDPGTDPYKLPYPAPKSVKKKENG